MKRLLGWLFAIAALAIVAFAVLNYGNYTSMCFDDNDTSSTPPQTEAPTVVDSLPAIDSLNLNVPNV